MSLWEDFLTNEKKIIGKWPHYFPIYERHFANWKNKSMVMLEIGVQYGGSLQMWQRYFGPFARIVGIDINPACRAHESPGVFVRIGDQTDYNFLQSLINEFGVPDIIIDDGGHVMNQISRSFEFFYPKMHRNAVYLVEDLHCAYWPEFGGGVRNPASFVELAKDFIDRLNADHTRGEIAPDVITRQTFGISFYDSVICFEKGDVFRKEHMETGTIRT